MRPDDTVVTARGLVTAAGDAPSALLDALERGRPPVEPTGAAGAEPSRAPIPDFDPRRYVERKGLKHLSRTSQLAVSAAAALREPLRDVPADRVGVVLGTAWAALETIVRFEREAHLEGPRFVDPLLFTETVANVPAGQVSIAHGWAALNVTLADGSGAGLAALHRARGLLDEGRADAIVAGGADGINPALLATLAARGAADFVASEGACLLVVERRKTARDRGAEPAARLAASAARHAATPVATAAAAALRDLLDDAGWRPADVDVVAVSSGGRPGREPVEAGVLDAVFGEDRPPVLAPKTALGETWAASGPLALSAAVEVLRAGRVPACPYAAALPGLGLPAEPIEGDLSRALLLDATAEGTLVALAVEREGGA